MSETVRQDSVAIVMPWFGRELKGGAELQAWNLASRLTARGYAVEVITTCCESFQSDWSSNHHSPGLNSEPEGFTVRRFSVESRDRVAFDRVCGYLLGLSSDALKPGVSPISEEDERIFCEHLIRSPALLTYLKTDGWRYAAFIFLPYLYGPILDGLPLVASRAFLQPCLHDEAYAYLRCVQRAVFAARKLLWLSEGEYELGRRLFGPVVAVRSVIGMAGVEALPDQSSNYKGASLPPNFPLSKPFVLVLGRKDVGKGTMLAVDAFRAYKTQTNSSWELVIAGPGSLSLADSEAGIHDLGLVTETERCWLLQNAKALLQPSPNESFSRVLFEAWQCEKPVIARESCLATACAVRACQGGLTAETVEEWASRLGQLEALSQDERDAVGRRGAFYAATIANWDRVMDRYDGILKPLVRQPEMSVSMRFSLVAIKAQRVRLLAEDREIGAWNLQPNHACETGWLDCDVKDPQANLRFESNQPACSYPPDFRQLGFNIKDMEVKILGSSETGVRFGGGWNRSEGGPGALVPRWSAGSADFVVQRKDSIGGPRAIHQVLSNLSYGDAIGNHTIWIRDQLQSMGFESEIFARHIAVEMLGQAYPLTSPDLLPTGSAIIYHHSIGTEITPWVCNHSGPRALIYHNITPAEFFEPYEPEFAAICRHGRETLPQLADYFPVSVGDSKFNADELTACGFHKPGVLPLCIDPTNWAFPPDDRIMADFQDGRTNILFVGRVAPNKRHEDLIYAFKFWLEEDPTARLLLVGSVEASSLYKECLIELAQRLRVDHAVHFIGKVNHAELNAYYRCANFFWCFSDHEGFCVPLIEACAYGIPIVARASGAVPETLGDAGLLLHGRIQPEKIVAMISSVRNHNNSAKMAARLATYSPAQVQQRLRALVDGILHISL